MCPQQLILGSKSRGAFRPFCALGMFAVPAVTAAAAVAAVAPREHQHVGRHRPGSTAAARASASARRWWPPTASTTPESAGGTWCGPSGSGSPAAPLA